MGGQDEKQGPSPGDGRDGSPHYPATQEVKWVIMAVRRLPELGLQGQLQISIQPWGPNEYKSREEALHHMEWLNSHPKSTHVLRFVVARRSYIQQIEGDMHQILREIGEGQP